MSPEATDQLLPTLIKSNAPVERSGTHDPSRDSPTAMMQSTRIVREVTCPTAALSPTRAPGRATRNLSQADPAPTFANATTAN
jgi:hypothetical protein